MGPSEKFVLANWGRAAVLETCQIAGLESFILQRWVSHSQIAVDRDRNPPVLQSKAIRFRCFMFLVDSA